MSDNYSDDDSTKCINQDDLEEEEEEEHDRMSPAANKMIDDMTLSLLMNKQSYARYISQDNPEKANEIKKKNDELYQYKDDIIEITMNKLKDPYLQISENIDELFERYTTSIIRHFKQKEVEKANRYNDDDDMMFEKIDEPEEKKHQESTNTHSSYWDKYRVNKQTHFSKDYFSKTKF
jgi:hypothetical protein